MGRNAHGRKSGRRGRRKEVGSYNKEEGGGDRRVSEEEGEKRQEETKITRRLDRPDEQPPSFSTSVFIVCIFIF